MKYLIRKSIINITLSIAIMCSGVAFGLAPESGFSIEHKDEFFENSSIFYVASVLGDYLSRDVNHETVISSVKDRVRVIIRKYLEGSIDGIVKDEKFVDFFLHGSRIDELDYIADEKIYTLPVSTEKVEYLYKFGIDEKFKNSAVITIPINNEVSVYVAVEKKVDKSLDHSEILNNVNPRRIFDTADEELSREDLEEEFRLIKIAFSNDIISNDPGLREYAKKLGVSIRDINECVDLAVDSLINDSPENDVKLVLFNVIVENEETYALACAKKDTYAYGRELLYELKRDIRAEFLMRVALSYGLSEMLNDAGEGDRLARILLRKVFPQNYLTRHTGVKGIHPELAGNLTLKINAFISLCIEDSIDAIQGKTLLDAKKENLGEKLNAYMENSHYTHQYIDRNSMYLSELKAYLAELLKSHRALINAVELEITLRNNSSTNKRLSLAYLKKNLIQNIAWIQRGIKTIDIWQSDGANSFTQEDPLYYQDIVGKINFGIFAEWNGEISDLLFELHFRNGAEHASDDTTMYSQNFLAVQKWCEEAAWTLRFHVFKQEVYRSELSYPRVRARDLSDSELSYPRVRARDLSDKEKELLEERVKLRFCVKYHRFMRSDYDVVNKLAYETDAFIDVYNLIDPSILDGVEGENQYLLISGLLQAICFNEKVMLAHSGVDYICDKMQMMVDRTRKIYKEKLTEDLEYVRKYLHGYGESGAIRKGVQVKDIEEVLKKSGALLPERALKNGLEIVSAKFSENNIKKLHGKNEIIDISKKYNMAAEDIFRIIRMAREDLVGPNSKELKQFPAIIRGPNKFAFGYAPSNGKYLAYTPELLKKLTPAIKAEYLMHEALCYHFTQINPVSGHQIARHIQKIFFPENYSDIKVTKDDKHKSLTGDLTIAIRECVLDHYASKIRKLLRDALDKGEPLVYTEILYKVFNKYPELYNEYFKEDAEAYNRFIKDLATKMFVEELSRIHYLLSQDDKKIRSGYGDDAYPDTHQRVESILNAIEKDKQNLAEGHFSLGFNSISELLPLIKITELDLKAIGINQTYLLRTLDLFRFYLTFISDIDLEYSLIIHRKAISSYMSVATIYLEKVLVDIEDYNLIGEPDVPRMQELKDQFSMIKDRIDSLVFENWGKLEISDIDFLLENLSGVYALLEDTCINAKELGFDIPEVNKLRESLLFYPGHLVYAKDHIRHFIDDTIYLRTIIDNGPLADSEDKKAEMEKFRSEKIYEFLGIFAIREIVNDRLSAMLDQGEMITFDELIQILKNKIPALNKPHIDDKFLAGHTGLDACVKDEVMLFFKGEVIGYLSKIHSYADEVMIAHESVGQATRTTHLNFAISDLKDYLDNLIYDFYIRDEKDCFTDLLKALNEVYNLLEILGSNGEQFPYSETVINIASAFMHISAGNNKDVMYRFLKMAHLPVTRMKSAAGIRVNFLESLLENGEDETSEIDDWDVSWNAGDDDLEDDMSDYGTTLENFLFGDDFKFDYDDVVELKENVMRIREQLDKLSEDMIRISEEAHEGKYLEPAGVSQLIDTVNEFMERITDISRDVYNLQTSIPFVNKFKDCVNVTPGYAEDLLDQLLYFKQYLKKLRSGYESDKSSIKINNKDFPEILLGKPAEGSVSDNQNAKKALLDKEFGEWEGPDSGEDVLNGMIYSVRDHLKLLVNGLQLSAGKSDHTMEFAEILLISDEFYGMFSEAVREHADLDMDSDNIIVGKLKGLRSFQHDAYILHLKEQVDLVSWMDTMDKLRQKSKRSFKWDFLNRFPGAKGIYLWRGIPQDDTNLEIYKQLNNDREESRAVTLKDRFFSYVQAYAQGDAGSTKALVLMYVPFESITLASWMGRFQAVDEAESVYEPDVVVSGNVNLEDLYCTDSKEDMQRMQIIADDYNKALKDITPLLNIGDQKYLDDNAESDNNPHVMDLEVYNENDITPDSEVIHARRFQGYVEDFQSKTEKKISFIALSTSWIDTYQDRGNQHQEGMNAIIAGIRNYCKKKDITFIEGDDAIVAEKVIAHKSDDIEAKGIVIGGLDCVTTIKAGFALELKLDRLHKQQVLMAGVKKKDPGISLECSYIPLMEQLALMMKLLECQMMNETFIRDNEENIRADLSNFGFEFDERKRIIIFTIRKLDVEALRPIYARLVSA